MEDAHAADLDLRYLDLDKYKKDSKPDDDTRAELPKEHVAFFAVYDGHGGALIDSFLFDSSISRRGVVIFFFFANIKR